MICPNCARRVPPHVETCRCGTRLPDAARVPDDAAPAHNWIPIAVLIGGLAVIGGGILYSSMRAPSASQPAAGPTLPSRPVPSPAQPVAAVPAAADVVEPPAERPTTRPNPFRFETPRTSGAPETSGIPATLEDVISQSMPAVVSIETSTAKGTGFFVQPSLLVTNAHVVETNTYVTVRLGSGQTATGRVSLAAPEYDLALVRVDASLAGQGVLEPRSFETVRVGQEVIAIGSALGVLQNTVTRGIISAVRRAGSVVLLQTDAAINPGNSGGPLIDRQGRVVGVTTMRMGQSAESIGFAVAIDHALPLIQAGRPAPSAPGPPLIAPRAMSPEGRSATDDARRAGIRTFERMMQALSARADELDGYWANFRRRCAPRPRGAIGDREWFGIWDERAVLAAPVGDCVSWLEEFVRATGSFRTAMASADETARTAQVFPGVRRDIRRKYRLDWTGWEQ